MSRAKMDREVRGRGIYGIASGGLAGDGDVFLVATETSARERLTKFFHEYLYPTSPVGTLVRCGYVDVDQARTLLESVADQMNGWAGTVHGECLDVSVTVEGFATLRVGIFKCWFGPDPAMPTGPNSYWIPPQVRLHRGAERQLDIAEKTTKR